MTSSKKQRGRNRRNQKYADSISHAIDDMSEHVMKKYTPFFVVNNNTAEDSVYFIIFAIIGGVYYGHSVVLDVQEDATGFMTFVHRVCTEDTYVVNRDEVDTVDNENMLVSYDRSGIVSASKFIHEFSNSVERKRHVSKVLKEVIYG